MDKKIVQTPSSFLVDQSFEDERFMKVRIRPFSSGVIARGHGIRFTRSCLENATSETFANIPVLANVVVSKDEDGDEKLDYGGHDFHVEPDKFNDGESRLAYEERVVGIVGETNQLEVVENGDGNNVDLFVNAFLFKDYGGYVCDILKERGGETSVSAEVGIDDLSVAEDGITDVGSITMYGITMLGEDVDPAIPGANLKMFSSKEDDRQTQMLSLMQELKESLDKYTEAVNAAQIPEEGGKDQMNHFEELLAQYGKTAEEITFEHENLSDEELDKAFAEAFSASTEENEPNVELAIYQTLAATLRDKANALENLVNASYSDTDEDYYFVDAYENPDYVVMHGCLSGKHYKQNYSKNTEGDYVLSDERIEVVAAWLTPTEQEALEKKNAEYEAMAEELAGLKAEPEKQAVLESEDYLPIAETTEYKELFDNHADITKEELTAKLDNILLTQVKKQNKETLAAKKIPDAGKVFPKLGNVSTGRYGGVFSK